MHCVVYEDVGNVLHGESECHADVLRAAVAVIRTAIAELLDALLAACAEESVDGFVSYRSFEELPEARDVLQAER